LTQPREGDSPAAVTTDRLTDSLERSWTLGAPLGRGTWGRARLLRGVDGREAVLKEPLGTADLPADLPQSDQVLAACRAAAIETADALNRRAHPFLPHLEATVDLGGGRLGLILPRYATLAERLGTELPLSEVLRIVVHATRLLDAAGTTHGALKPNNVMVSESGDLLLSDPLPGAVAPARVLLAVRAGHRPWLPPEAQNGAVLHPADDTWALAQLLHVAAAAETTEDGLDKVGLASVRDRARTALQEESSNPRFRSRVADRLAAMLSRALSPEREPSPPYRFDTHLVLQQRTAEVLALVRPRVEDVGKVLMPGTSDSATFRGGEPVRFTVAVACTPGVTDHDDLVCGVQLTDLDAEGEAARVAIADAQFAVQQHPSGRLRYKLELPSVEPGRYQVRVAFAVKDAAEAPKAATANIEVRPPPGYVPPAKDPPPPEPLTFPGARQSTAPPPEEDIEDALRDLFDEEDTVTDPGPRETPAPGFPRPVAPPADFEESVEDPLSVELSAADVEAAMAGIAPPVRQHRRPVSLTDHTVADDDLLSAFPASEAHPDEDPDLPGLDDVSDGSDLPEHSARVAEVLRRDTTLAVGAAIAASLALILVLTLLTRAC